MMDGKIVKTGGPGIALELEEGGYADYREFEPA
jgi:Fe-S cluster assembly ATPase SufC